MRYLLDTNICIYLIKKRPTEVFDRFRRNSPKDCAISTITLFELQYGVEKSLHRQLSEAALTRFLMPLNLLDFDISAAREAAAIRAELERQGTPIGSYDLLIAGIARSRDMVLVTNNTKEFDRVVRLNVENWAL